MGNCIFLRRGAPPSSEPQLGDLEPGSLIGIEENGTQVPFIVLAHGYPAAERTLVLRQDCYDERIFNNRNSFNNSYIYNWLNNNYLALLSSDVQSMIDTVTIKCVRGSGSGMLIDVSAKIFLLSGVETGCDAGYMSGSEGEAIPYFNSNLRRIAYLNQTPVVWWTRPHIISILVICGLYRKMEIVLRKEKQQTIGMNVAAVQLLPFQYQ